MDLRILFRESFLPASLVLSVLLVLMTACGGSDDVYIDPAAKGSSELVTQSNSRVQMITSTCGTAPTTNVVHSYDLDAPTIMTTGQIVSGSVFAGSYKHVNYWDIALEAGFYHVVLESEAMDKKQAKLGLNLTDLNGIGATDGTQIIGGSASDILALRARFYGFIELEEARNVVLKAKVENLSENYKLAVFESESAVPSPFLSDCPTVNELSRDATESFILSGRSIFSEDQWYRVELDTKAYLLKTTAALSGGASGGIQYSVFYIDQFGGLQTGHSIDHTGTNIDGISRIKLTEPGPIWIRIENNNINELSVDITLTPEN